MFYIETFWYIVDGPRYIYFTTDSEYSWLPDEHTRHYYNLKTCRFLFKQLKKSTYSSWISKIHIKYEICD